MTDHTDAALDFAFNAAKEGKHVAYFSLGTPAEELAARLIGLPLERVQKKDISPEEFSSLVEISKGLQDTPLYIDDTPNLTVEQVCERVRKLAKTRCPDLLIIDSFKKLEDSWLEAVEIIDPLMELEKELNLKFLFSDEISDDRGKFQKVFSLVQKELEELEKGEIEPYEFSES